MAVRMQQRRATAEQWLLADPVLAEGEIGLETDTYSFKIGDGVNNWSLLDYFESGASLQATIDDYIPLTQKGVALGVAELDANGFVPASQLDIDVSGDINAAIAALVDSAPATLDTLNELAAALGDDANFATTITTSISSGDAATLASAQSYADQAELDAVATANAYTDAEIAAIPPVDLTGYATETYADQAEADAKTYADGLASNYDVAGSASTAESNANTYTDNLIGDGTVDGTAGNTVTDRIATAVSNLVDSAPATLDTLNELAAALGDDANFATTVTNSIAAKANSTNPEFSVSGTTTSFTHDIDDLALGVGLYVVWDATNVYVSTTGNNLLSLFSSSSTQIDLTVSYYGTAYTYSTNTISVGVLPSGGIVEYPGNDAFIFAHGGNNPGTSNSTGGGDSGFSSGDQISVSTPTLSISSSEVGYLDGTTSGIQTQLDNKTDKLQPISAKTGAYTLQASDNQSLITCDGTFTITVPSGTFSGGERVDFINIGTGVIAFAGSGVTIDSKDAALTLDTQYAAASIILTSSTQGYLVGSIA